MKNTLEYRKERIHNIAKKCNGKTANNLFVQIEIPNLLLKNLLNSLMLFVAKAMHFDPVLQKRILLKK